MKRQNVNRKGIKIIRQQCRGYLGIMLLKNVVISIIPYMNFYLSAEFINALFDGNNSFAIKIIVFTLGLNGILSICKSFFEILYKRKNAELDADEAYLFCKKILGLSMEMIESSEVRKKRKKIVEAAKIDDNGRKSFLQSIDRIEQGFFNLIFSCLLAAELFVTLLIGKKYLSLFLFIILNVASITIYVIFNNIKEKKNNKLASDMSNYMVEENRLDDAFDLQKLGKDIRLYGIDKYINATKDHLLEIHKKSFSKFQKKKVGFEIGSVIIYYLFQVISYTFICAWAMMKVVKVGSILKYIGLVQGMINATIMIIQGKGRLKGNMIFLNEYTGFLELPGECQKGNIEVPKEIQSLEFKDVSFKYKNSEKYALKNVSFSVKRGEHVALVGVNGSGKTTLIKLLCRFYRPTEGKILLNDIDIESFNYRDYVSLISPVFQDFELLSFPIAENVSMSQTYNLEKCEACMKKSMLDEDFLTDNNRLSAYLNKDFDADGIYLSKGEAQKLAIARALYKEGSILVLDEPTASLDSLSEIAIYKQFHTEQQEKNVFFITHRLSSTIFCDRILVFYDGEIIETGNHETLLDMQGEYYKLWMAQAQYYV